MAQIKGLEGLVNLEEIYMSHNGIQKLESFENNVCTLHYPYKNFLYV